MRLPILHWHITDQFDEMLMVIIVVERYAGNAAMHVYPWLSVVIRGWKKANTNDIQRTI